MRKILFIASLALAIFNSAKAQYLVQENYACAIDRLDLAGDQELKIGYGILPSIQVFSAVDVIDIYTTNNYTNTKVTGAGSIGYKIYLSKNLSFGIYGGMERESGNLSQTFADDYSLDSWETNQLGTFTRTTYVLAGEVTLNILNYKNITFYTTLGLGNEFVHETDYYSVISADSLIKSNFNRFAFYISPYGAKFGGPRLSGNVEMGLGYKGMFNFSLNYKIFRSKHAAKREAEEEDAKQEQMDEEAQDRENNEDSTEQ